STAVVRHHLQVLGSGPGQRPDQHAGNPAQAEPASASDAPDGTSPTASAALATSLSTAAPFRPSSPAARPLALCRLEDASRPVSREAVLPTLSGAPHATRRTQAGAGWAVSGSGQPA